MEHINKIELQGVVGFVRLNEVCAQGVANFSLATDCITSNHLGIAVTETCWHNVCAWEGKGVCDLNQIQKGSRVHVVGRMRSSRYTDAEGNEKTFYEVLASEVTIINEE